MVSSDSQTIKSVPIDADLDAATYPIMVVAIKTPDEITAGNSTEFRVGTNQNGETAPAYIRASSCGAVQPVALTSIGVTSNYIIKVTGNPTTATVLDVDSNTIEGFTLYPNPVKDTLFLNAQDAIEEVSIYNVLGQRVLQVVPNVLNTSIPLTGVETGMYIVKVKAGNKTATYRVVKE